MDIVNKLINKIAGEYPAVGINQRAARITSFYTGINFVIGFFVAVTLQLALHFIVFQVIAAAILFFFYYLLVHKKYSGPIILLLVIMLTSAFAIDWFYAGGLYGPALISALPIFYVAINIVSEKYRPAIGIFVLTVVAVTLMISYLDPSWVTPYPKTDEGYIHYMILVFQYCGYIVFIGASNRYCYNYEHNMVTSQYLELEQANDAKLRLFSIISHDLRGPMVTLGGILNSMEEGFSTPEKTKRQLAHLKTMTAPLNNTINNLLLWSRQQLEGLNVSPELFEVGEILDEEILLVAEEAISKMVIIENHIVPQTAVFADINQVRIIFRNLISNAIRHGKSNTVVQLFHHSTEANMVFTISNNGVPVPLYAAEEFNNTGKLEIDDANKKHPGLGLQLCRAFVKVNGGNIWIDTSVVGKTVFCFSLPVGKGQ